MPLITYHIYPEDTYEEWTIHFIAYVEAIAICADARHIPWMDAPSCPVDPFIETQFIDARISILSFFEVKVTSIIFHPGPECWRVLF